MKVDIKNKNYIVILTVGETQNIATFENYEEMINYVKRGLNAAQDGVDIIDLENKMLFTIYDAEDLKNMEVEYDK